MRREVYGWHSDRVGRHMNIIVHGHWGPPMILFPTSGGDEGEYERQTLIGIPFLDIGRDRCAAAEKRFNSATESGTQCDSFIGRGRREDAVHHTLVHERHGVNVRRLRDLAIAKKSFAAFCEHQSATPDDPGIEIAGPGVNVTQRQNAEHCVLVTHSVCFTNSGGV